MIIKQNLDDQAYEVIQNMILNAKYKAGHKIIPNDISSELGISRTPITHALKRLEQEGLITAIQGGKYCIPQYKEEDVNEIFDARLLIEKQAVRTLIKTLDNKKIKELKSLAKSYIEMIDKKDVELSVKADFGFHNYLVKSMNNSRIDQFFLMLQKQLIIYRYIGTKINERLHDSADEHISVINYIEAKDEEKAVDMIETHIENSRILTLKRYNLA
jgi:Transcriptional regulators